MSKNPKMAAFVPTCGDAVLGVAVLSREQCDKASIEWMKTAYRLEDYLSRQNPANVTPTRFHTMSNDFPKVTLGSESKISQGFLNAHNKTVEPAALLSPTSPNQTQIPSTIPITSGRLNIAKAFSHIVGYIKKMMAVTVTMNLSLGVRMFSVLLEKGTPCNIP